MITTTTGKFRKDIYAYVSSLLGRPINEREHADLKEIIMAMIENEKVKMKDLAFGLQRQAEEIANLKKALAKKKSEDKKGNGFVSIAQRKGLPKPTSLL